MASSSASCRSGKTIQSDERNIIACVIKCCDDESKQRCLAIPLNQATARAAKYCNKSTKTIQRIRNEIRRYPEGAVLPTPGATRKCSDARKAVVDEFDRRVIRNVIEEFYLFQHTVPTCSKLLPVLRERINFKWKRTTLRKIIIEMGYQWKKFGPKKRVLIEKEEIVNARCEYLQKIRHLKQGGKPILYLDETWVDAKLRFRQCQANKKFIKEAKDVNESEKVHIVHIGGSNGFLHGCELVYTTDDRQVQLTWEIIKTWIYDKVIPCLVTPSIIVVHNINFEGRTVDKPPSKSSSKKETVGYLRSRGIPCDEVMRKFTLMSLVDNTMKKENVHNFENLLAAHGHTVIRLPMNLCDLNPMELAWRQVREYLQSLNVAAYGTISLRRLGEFMKEGIKRVKKEDWARYCHYVTGFEDSFWEKDASIEEVIDKIISKAVDAIDISDYENSDPDSFDETDNSDSEDDDEDSLRELDSKPPPEIIEYKLEQPTVLEKIEITKNILDKSKVAQSPSLTGTTTPLNTTCRYSGSGRPLEKRPRQETAAAEDDLNDDKMFMLSVAGKMKHLSPADNLKFRLEVQQLLLDKLCPDVENNASTSGTSQNASFAAVMIKEEVEEETLTDENLMETPPIEIKKEVEENTVDSSTNELNMDYN